MFSTSALSSSSSTKFLVHVLDQLVLKADDSSPRNRKQWRDFQRQIGHLLARQVHSVLHQVQFEIAPSKCFLLVQHDSH